MKRLLLLATFIVATIASLSFVPTSAQAKHIHATITSNNGTVVTVDGNYHFHLIPPSYVFTGTVTIEDPTGRKTTLHFKNSKLYLSASSIGQPELVVTLNAVNPCDVTTAFWSDGPGYLLNLLNSPAMNQQIVSQIRGACDD